MNRIIIFLIVFCCSFISVNAVPGDLDLSFDGDGKVLTQIGGLQFTGNAAAIQADGKILVAGATSSGDFAVVRYNSDGSLDTTFDGDGLVTTDIANSDDNANAIAIQTDGKIIVAGNRNFSDFFDSADFAVVRYNTDGSLDSSFDGDGKLTTAVTDSGSDIAFSIALQADGKILVGGRGNADFAVVRYNTDGSLDSLFGVAGIFTADVNASSVDVATSIAVQSDGKIVLAGYARIGSNNDFAAIRILASGSNLDTTFDADGVVITDLGSNGDQSFSMAIQMNGKIVLAGTTNIHIALVRYNTDGSLDTSLDGDGIVVTNVSVDSSFAKAVKIQTDGKIIAAGRRYNGTDAKFVVVRYQSNGSLDTTWGTNGIASTDFGFVDDQANALAIQPDGKLVATGFANGNFAVARYLTSCGDALLDANFGACGKNSVGFGIGNAVSNDMAIQTDGKIVLVGNYDGSLALARFNTDGILDTGFGNQGKVLTSFPPNGGEFLSVALQSDGKIVVAGSLQINLAEHDFVVVRYNSDGTLDQSFDSDGIWTASFGLTDFAYAVEIQTDGKIVVGGTRTDAANTCIFNTACQRGILARLNSDGSFDTSFDSDGVVILQTSPFSYIFRDISIQLDGKIIAAGSKHTGLTSLESLLVRYNSDGSPDTSFNGSGRAEFYSSAQLWKIAIQPDGKIIAIGEYESARDVHVPITFRYNSNGTFDTSFSGDGTEIFSHPIYTASYADFYSLAVQSNGKIVIIGQYMDFLQNNNPTYFLTVRYNSNGTLDNSLWGNGGVVLTEFGNHGNRATSVKIQPDGKIAVGGFSGNNYALARFLGELAPTAANVSISGRVSNSNGQGIGKVHVSLTDVNGTTRSVYTSSFGYYKFDELPAGQTYILSVNHKRYVFEPDTRILNAVEDVYDVDFTANE